MMKAFLEGTVRGLQQALVLFNVSAICRYRQHFLMLDKGLDIEIAKFFIIDEIFDDANPVLSMSSQ